MTLLPKPPPFPLLSLERVGILYAVFTEQYMASKLDFDVGQLMTVFEPAIKIAAMHKPEESYNNLSLSLYTR